MYMTQQNKYVTFRSGKEYFGLKIEYVNEIVVYQEITQVPETPEYIKGLINLRGKIIPVIDVRTRFKMEPVEYNDRTCIIVVRLQEMVIGLIVEQIAEVVEILPEDILDPPVLGKEEKSVENKYVYGIGQVGNSVKLLIDPEKLLKDEDISLLEDMEETSEEATEEGE
ncbi:MAG: purine-binding chemotaxis protein CheW [Lachnospiraceae bacterium]|nr:purine-binding chemotaxis protein CheW [Lachnospiraceae bacterium]